MFPAYRYLRINPLFAPAWVSPQTLRFGFNKKALEISGLTEKDHAIISSLLTGTTLQALHRAAERLKINTADFHSLLKTLQPVLEILNTVPDQGVPLLIAPAEYQIIIATDFTEANQNCAKLLATELAEYGQQNTANANTVLLLTDYMLQPQVVFQQQELNPELQYIPVVFGDSAVVIGPVLQLTDSPCAVCVESQRLTADKDLELMAPQLFGRAAATTEKVALKLLTPYLARVISDPSLLQRRRLTLEFTASNLPAATSSAVTTNSECLCTNFKADHGQPHSTEALALLPSKSEKILELI